MRRNCLCPSVENLESLTSCSSLLPGNLLTSQENDHRPKYVELAANTAVAPASRRIRDFVPGPPPVYCSTDVGQNWGYHLNNVLGTCVPAAQINVFYAQMESAGYYFQVPDSSVLIQYERVGGYVPGNPATDKGEWPMAAEFDWMHNGYLDPSGYTHRAVACGPVDFRNYTKLAESVYLYQGAILSVALPADAITQFVNGQTWTVTAGPGSAPWSAGGHEVAIVGYNYTGPIAITWGRVQQTTWAWMSTYGTECEATVNSEEISPNGHAVNGLTINQLVADLKYVA